MASRSSVIMTTAVAAAVVRPASRRAARRAGGSATTAAAAAPAIVGRRRAALALAWVLVALLLPRPRAELLPRSSPGSLDRSRVGVRVAVGPAVERGAGVGCGDVWGVVCGATVWRALGESARPLGAPCREPSRSTARPCSSKLTTWAAAGARTGMRWLKLGAPDSPMTAGTAIAQAHAAPATTITAPFTASVLPPSGFQPPSDNGTSTYYGGAAGSVQWASKPGSAATTTAQSDEVGSMRVKWSPSTSCSVAFAPALVAAST